MLTSSHPRAQFSALLGRVMEIWQERREDVVNQAADITRQLTESAQRPAVEGEITTELLDVAARNRFFRLFIEFHVVGAQPRALISDVHIAVGDKEIAAPALRHCREIYDAAFARRKSGLLPFGALAEKRGRQQENQARAQKKRAERGT